MERSWRGPEFRSLNDSQAGDILLLEQVDRLSRLTDAEWQKLKAELTLRWVRVVALDLPTSWIMATSNTDEFTSRMFEAISGMLLDMLVEAHSEQTCRGQHSSFSFASWAVLPNSSTIFSTKIRMLPRP